MNSIDKIADWLADCIVHVLDRSPMYGCARHTENTLRMYFRFAAAASSFETLLETQMQEMASRVGHPWGGIVEGYYMQHPDADDEAVRGFVVSQYGSLAENLPLKLPDRSTFWYLKRPEETPTRSASRVASPDDYPGHERVDSLIVWVKQAIREVCSDAMSSRSATDFEDELSGLIWFWGIVIGDAEGINEQLTQIHHKHRCYAYGSVAWQFCIERPWSTKAEAISYVSNAYRPLWQAIIEGH